MMSFIDQYYYGSPNNTNPLSDCGPKKRVGKREAAWDKVNAIASGEKGVLKKEEISLARQYQDVLGYSVGEGANVKLRTTKAVMTSIKRGASARFLIAELEKVWGK